MSLAAINFGKMDSTSLAPKKWRANNLSGLRLGLAGLVVFSHSYPLTSGLERDPLSWLTADQVTAGTMAVRLFFVISGMLITASWLNSSSMADYLRRRIFRIYPGFLAASFLSVVLAVICSPSFREVVVTKSWLRKYFLAQFWLSDEPLASATIFPAVPFPGCVNGSLWSISQEFACYLAVAGLGIFCLFKRRELILFLSTLVLLVYGFAVVRFGKDFSLAAAFTFFFAGVCVYLWRDRIPTSRWWFFGVLLILAVASRLPPLLHFLLPAGCALLVLAISRLPQLRVTAWCDRTDLSYGLYLYAFPVQQFLAFAGMRAPLLMFALALPISLAMGAMSWFLIEKRFLDLKRMPFQDFDPAANIRAG